MRKLGEELAKLAAVIMCIVAVFWLIREHGHTSKASASRLNAVR